MDAVKRQRGKSRRGEKTGDSFECLYVFVQTQGGNKCGVLTVEYIVCVPRVIIYSVSIEMFTLCCPTFL